MCIAKGLLTEFPNSSQVERRIQDLVSASLCVFVCACMCTCIWVCACVSFHDYQTKLGNWAVWKAFVSFVTKLKRDLVLTVKWCVKEHSKNMFHFLYSSGEPRILRWFSSLEGSVFIFEQGRTVLFLFWYFSEKLLFYKNLLLLSYSKKCLHIKIVLFVNLYEINEQNLLTSCAVLNEYSWFWYFNI